MRFGSQGHHRMTDFTWRPNYAMHLTANSRLLPPVAGSRSRALGRQGRVEEVVGVRMDK